MSEPHCGPLSIALDASLWDEPTTGIGLYTHQLARVLEAAGVRVRLLGARRSGEAPRGSMRATSYFLTRLPSILSGLEEPLFHGVCNFTLPLTRIPGKRFVLTVHDIIPDLMGDTVSFAFRWQFRLWLRRSLKIADQVICASKRTCDDLIERFGVSLSKLSVVHLGVDHLDSVGAPSSEEAAYLRSLNLPAVYVLYAGALDARKNVSCLLDALERLRVAGRSVTTAFVGQAWFGSEPIERRISQMRLAGFDLRPLGYQPAAIYREIMRRATLFVFPSLYEGFGLPPLEAMYLGVPVIVSRDGALPEVCGDSAVQLDPRHCESLASSIARLLDSPAERRARSEAGQNWAIHFSWEATALKTLSVYRTALNSHQGSETLQP